MPPPSLPYWTGNTEIQLATRMKMNSVTASGSRNGATRMPMELSTWPRICEVRVSKNSCTGLGTPDVILART